MADYPIKELNNSTPMECAHTPNMDYMAKYAVMGMVKTIPHGFPPGSDVANLSIMGYDPRLYYTGRSPLEAVSMGVPLTSKDVAFRCNLVTLSNEEYYLEKRMIDYSADEITTEEAACLIEEVKKKYDTDYYNFYPGVSYRHLMVWHNGPSELEMIPPHDIAEQKIIDYLPKGQGADQILKFMILSNEWLEQHPVNQRRIEMGLRPANSLWFWGHGRRPALTSFYDKYFLRGGVISAVDLIKGLGICIGLHPIAVPGATGNIHTNFKGKALAALQLLEEGLDFAYIHVGAPDEAGHRGDLSAKIKAIEEIDEKVIGVLLKGLQGFADYKLMVLPDHATPLSHRTHTADPVPFLISRKSKKYPSGLESFSEKNAALTGFRIDEGFRLMDHFIG